MSNLYVSVHLQKGLPGAHRILTAIEVRFRFPAPCAWYRGPPR